MLYRLVAAPNTPEREKLLRERTSDKTQTLRRLSKPSKASQNGSHSFLIAAATRLFFCIFVTALHSFLGHAVVDVIQDLHKQTGNLLLVVPCRLMVASLEY